MGKSLRKACKRGSHAAWKAPPGRPDPVRLLVEADKGRMPELVPVRHGRMVMSPFAFYRGAALHMAVDLAATPTTGLRVQCCGDAHLLNFGGFATQERRVLFAVNDLDETLPAPWEWDLKRLAASFVVASRDSGLRETAARDAVLTCARSYREHMAEFGGMKPLDLWNLAIEIEESISSISDAAIRRRLNRRLAKARGRSVPEELFPELVSTSGGSPVFKDQHPTIFHWRHARLRVGDALAGYRESLAHAQRVLLDRYEVKDVAIKVVGVGSVGTACWVVLLMDVDGDPLILQVKEARPSVLEAWAGKSAFPNHGERIVNGYRLMQPAGDMFLGWTAGASGRHYYFRQLRDVKVKFPVEEFDREEMTLFAEYCGHALALSHARSGEPACISGYLGKSDAFDEALAAFSFAYADQTVRDHGAVERAVRKGKVRANE
jgi:uncharacterized protein (DUF2252 family)